MLTVRTTLTARLLVLLFAFGLLAGCRSANGYVANRSGKANYKRGNYMVARQEFQRAVMDDPWNADYRHNLAASMAKLGDPITAERVYQDAINADPGHQPSYHGLARLMQQQGRAAEATNMLQTWAGVEPYSAAPYVEMAWLQRETGDFASAERTLRQALKVEPRHPIALAQLGQVYQDTGQSDRALAMYQGSLQSRWYQGDVHKRVAALRRERRMGPYGSMLAAQPGFGPVMASQPGFGAPVYVSNPVPTQAAVPEAARSAEAVPDPAKVEIPPQTAVQPPIPRHLPPPIYTEALGAASAPATVQIIDPAVAPAMHEESADPAHEDEFEPPVTGQSP
jgi:Tfp pilus assembly protein PilF